MYRLLKFLFTGFWECNHTWEIKEKNRFPYFHKAGENIPYKITYVYTLRCSKCGEMESYNEVTE